MEVYVEDVFLDNFIINAILLFATSKLMHLGATKWHILAASALGVGMTIFNLFFSLQGFWLLVFKIILGVLMVLCVCKKPTPLKFFLSFMTFLCLTFIVGGACLAIALTFGSVILTESGEIAYTLALPMGVVVGICFLLAWAISKLFISLKNRLLRQNFVFSASLNGIKMKAFLDTGNRLVDPESGRPITFISLEYFSKIFKVPLSTIILKRKTNALKNMHYISASTISSKKDIMVFCVDELKLWQNKEKFVIKNAMLGLTFLNLEEKLECGLLLNPLVLNGEYNE